MKKIVTKNGKKLKKDLQRTNSLTIAIYSRQKLRQVGPGKSRTLCHPLYEVMNRPKYLQSLKRLNDLDEIVGKGRNFMELI